MLQACAWDPIAPRISSWGGGTVPIGTRAVSQLLWPDKDREEWFSLGENNETGRGFGLHQLLNRHRPFSLSLPSTACWATPRRLYQDWIMLVTPIMVCP